jgi:hypothetical protein
VCRRPVLEVLDEGILDADDGVAVGVERFVARP